MKRLLLISSVLVAGLTSYVFAAGYTAGVSIDARVGGYIVGGGTAFETFTVETTTDSTGAVVYQQVPGTGQAIGDNAQEYDTTKITFDASIDNVSASVTFAANSVDGGATNFITLDSFNVKASDLFGMLTLQFYDWGYSAGSSANEGDYILSDIGFPWFLCHC